MACGDDDSGSADGSGTEGQLTSTSTGLTTTSGGTVGASTSTGGTTTGSTTEGSAEESGTESESESDTDTAGGTDTEDATGTDTEGTNACAGAAWDAPDWEDNTVEALAIRQQLADLSSAMRSAETAADGAPASIEDLEDLWTAGEPSLADITSEGYAAVVVDSFEEFMEAIEAGPQNLVNEAGLWAPGDAGGIYGAEGTRAINEGGLELRQLVDKGVFSGGAFYRYALSLTEGEIDAADIDAIAAVWGANATMDPAADPGLDDAANYGNTMGFFEEMAGHLATAKSLTGDDACTAERDAALVSFFRSWEQSMFARFVFYVEVARAESDSTTDHEILAHALHAIAEGIGLAAGFYGLEDPAEGPLADAGRVVTDAQLEDIMAAIGVDLSDLGASTLGTLLENPSAFEDARDSAEEGVAEALDLESSVVEGWRVELTSE